MKTIAYYISDYGFGHAARSIAIIRELVHRFDGNIKIVICHSYAVSFLKESLEGLPVEYRNINTDVGYVLKQNSMNLDVKELERKFLGFMEQFPEKIKEERDFLLNRDVDLVISDISPLPFTPAKELGIPSIGISNFTWYTAYKGMIHEAYLAVLKDAYTKMDYYFSLASSNEPEWGIKGKEPFNLIARESTSDNVVEIIQHVNPNSDKTIVYFGLGMKVDVELRSLKLWNSDQCVFLVSNNVDIDLPNVYKIPREYTESQNYIAASDIVITKAGWGTVSEAVLNRKPLLILDRSVMNEDRNTINYLRSINHIRLFTWEELESMIINVDLVQELSGQDTDEVRNDVTMIANRVIDLLVEN